jgi:transglutaminase-like putative cysteine protease
VQLLEPTDRPFGLFIERAGSAIPARYRSKTEYHYRQVLRPQDPSRWRAPPMRGEYIQALARRQPVPGLEAWTVRLLRRLEPDSRYGLHGVLPPPGRGGSERAFLLDPAGWEATARALADYLARGGDYAHSFELRSADMVLDPVWDFLTNVKAAHCEHFASALTLMLRSVGIPARVVKGYVGQEHQGGGTYIVRHSHAHSWVEVLVPAADRGAEDFDWLSLDPTPDAGGTPPPFSLAHWFDKSRENTLKLWSDLIIGYNADFQAELMERLTGLGPAGILKVLGVVAAIPALLVALAWLRRRRQRYPRLAIGSPVSFYSRLLWLLARYRNLVPQRGQTPREFGETAGAALRTGPATAGLADLPGRAVELLYRVRFGGQCLAEEERQILEGRLDALAAALR